MLSFPTLSLLAGLVGFSGLAQGLHVVPSSPQCADLCGNVLTGTSGSEISCTDSSYASSAYGATFKACIACEMSSTYYDSASRLSDLHWALYNMRYALSWCLFGFDNNTVLADTPCLTKFSCGPLQDAFGYDSLNDNATSYSYCPLMASVSVPKCSQCLQEMGNEWYLSNFVTALEGACVQTPDLGATVTLQGNIFSQTVVNITTPTPSNTSTFTPSTGLPLGAKIGIAVAGIVLILIIAGCSIILVGRRRRRAFLRERQLVNFNEDWRAHHQFQDDAPSGDESSGGGGLQQPPQMRDGGSSAGGFFDSPDSQRPLHPWAARMEEESPMSAQGEKVYFSPYSSQYTSPVSAVDAIPVKGREWPMDRKGSVTGGASSEWPGDRKGSLGSAFGAAVGRSWSRDRKEKGKEEDGVRIEMKNVPPVLLHPGHGRGGSVALTEDDARRGNAM